MAGALGFNPCLAISKTTQRESKFARRLESEHREKMKRNGSL